MATVQASELVSVNPATLEVVGSVSRTAPAEVPGVVARGAERQREWVGLPPAARARVLREAVRLLRRDAAELAGIVSAETGKPGIEALTQDVYPALDHATWLARHASSLLRDERIRFPQLHLKAKRGRVAYEPLGVVAAVTPWNIPLGIPFLQAATAVAAGNAVVLKPSDLTPLCGVRVASLLVEAGAPPGLVQVAQGGAEVGEALVADAGVAKVFFTGSVEVGRLVAASAGARGCPVALELGGRDPMLVFADADLERAVDGATFAAFLNGGQACVSAERILVERELYDEFAARLRERTATLRVGEEVGPLISERQRDAVQALTGAERAERTGWFLRPTVLEGELPDRELFGPAVVLEPFEGEDEAVRLANGSAYGLGASVWTRDRRRAERVARRLEAGMVWANDVGYSFAAGQVGWGGAKASGFGRTGGRQGLLSYVRTKYLDWDSGRLRPVWWFPYDARVERSLLVLLDVLYGPRGGRVAAAWRHRRELAYAARRALRT